MPFTGRRTERQTRWIQYSPSPNLLGRDIESECHFEGYEDQPGALKFTNPTMHVSYPTMHHSEQKCSHFCSEWCIVGYGTDALWDLSDWDVEIHSRGHAQNHQTYHGQMIWKNFSWTLQIKIYTKSIVVKSQALFTDDTSWNNSHQKFQIESCMHNKLPKAHENMCARLNTN